MELRGFKFCGIGPSEPELVPRGGGLESMSLGGDKPDPPEGPSCPSGAMASCIAGLHLYTPLPFISAASGAGSFARLHAFALSGLLLTIYE